MSEPIPLRDTHSTTDLKEGPRFIAKSHDTDCFQPTGFESRVASLQLRVLCFRIQFVVIPARLFTGPPVFPAVYSSYSLRFCSLFRDTFVCSLARCLAIDPAWACARDNQAHAMRSRAFVRRCRARILAQRKSEKWIFLSFFWRNECLRNLTTKNAGSVVQRLILKNFSFF